MDVEGAGDDQAELVDVDRLAVEIIGAEPIAFSALSRAPWPDATMTLVSGFSCRICGQRREAFGGAVGVGRKAEVERDHRRLVQPHRLDRGGAVAGDDHS